MLVSSQTPSGIQGRTLGPPSVGTSRPEAASAVSRTASPGSRIRFDRASSRLTGSLASFSGVTVACCR